MGRMIGKEEIENDRERGSKENFHQSDEEETRETKELEKKKENVK